MVPEAVDASTTAQDTSRLVTLTRLLIPRYRLRLYLPINQLDHYTPTVSHVTTEQFLPQRHHTDTRTPREPYIHLAVEKLFITVEESVVESDADFICVQQFIHFLLLQILTVLRKHVAHLRLGMLRQPSLEHSGDVLPILTVAVCHREKVTVLETTEMRHCDPAVLVLLVWVTW